MGGEVEMYIFFCYLDRNKKEESPQGAIQLENCFPTLLPFKNIALKYLCLLHCKYTELYKC